MRDGEQVLTDGPFADVAESFGGYWIVEVPDLDTALKHAAECPAAAEVGSVEVRAIAELGRVVAVPVEVTVEGVHRAEWPALGRLARPVDR